MTAVGLAVSGVAGIVTVGPPPLKGNGVPAASLVGRLGQLYFDSSTVPYTEYVFNGTSWIATGNTAGTFTALTVSGLSTLGAVTQVGTASFNTTGTATTTIGNSTAGVASNGDLTVTNGNVKIATSGKGLQVKGGAATDFVGTATLVAGTVTVSNTNIATGDLIIPSRIAANASTTLGQLSYTISNGASFTVTSLILGTPGSTQTGDLSTFAYIIVRPL